MAVTSPALSMEVWPQIIAGKVCRTEVLPRPRLFRRGSVPAHGRGRRPRRPAILFSKGMLRAPERGSLLAAATCCLFSLMPPAGNVPRPRARVTFGRSPKSDQKRCLKPQVSRLPARLGASGNVTVYHAKIRMALIAAQRIACGPLIAAAPAYGAGGVLVYRLGDDQIAHLPPPAASVCAARWAADFYIGRT